LHAARISRRRQHGKQQQQQRQRRSVRHSCPFATFPSTFLDRFRSRIRRSTFYTRYDSKYSTSFEHSVYRTSIVEYATGIDREKVEGKVATDIECRTDGVAVVLLLLTMLSSPDIRAAVQPTSSGSENKTNKTLFFNHSPTTKTLPGQK